MPRIKIQQTVYNLMFKDPGTILWDVYDKVCSFQCGIPIAAFSHFCTVPLPPCCMVVFVKHVSVSLTLVLWWINWPLCEVVRLSFLYNDWSKLNMTSVQLRLSQTQIWRSVCKGKSSESIACIGEYSSLGFIEAVHQWKCHSIYTHCCMSWTLYFQM